MPTGYTAGVEDGTIKTFEEFALLCARAFGALVHMRDDSLSVKIPEKFEPNPHYDEEYKRLSEELAKVLKMPERDCLAKAMAEYEKGVLEKEKAIATRKVETARFTSMMKKVEAWVPPTADHVGLKKFMLEQLKISIVPDSGFGWWKLEKPTSGEKWRKDEIARLSESIERARVSYNEEVKRTKERNEWVQVLRKSLEEKP